VAALGISNDSTVVVYDTVDGRWASRLWFLFRAYGHDAVAVLDGGWSHWVAQGKPYDLGDVRPEPADFLADERTDHWADKAFVEAVVAGDEQAALVCGTPLDEFDGGPGPLSRSGHIPGSVSVPAESLWADDGTLAREHVLRDRLALVPDEPRTVVYCASGVSASVDALALAVVGRRDVAVYDGSLAEWVADPAAPLQPAAA
jgi:thiosulfate/3-mercaptopyruvate sulfurtransferase